MRNRLVFGAVHLHFGGFPPVFVPFLIAETAEYYLLQKGPHPQVVSLSNQEEMDKNWWETSTKM